MENIEDRERSQAAPPVPSSSAPSSSILSHSMSTRNDSFPLASPFMHLGPVEWSYHGLQARAGNSPTHGHHRFWITYCPSTGSSPQQYLVSGPSYLGVQTRPRQHCCAAHIPSSNDSMQTVSSMELRSHYTGTTPPSQC